MLVARSHGARLELPGADLEMANLPHVDLRFANLAGANLRGAMLWGALLDGACLDGADLTCDNLTWSNLYGCGLKGALLIEADLDEALVGPSLADAVTLGADLVTVTPMMTGPDSWAKVAGGTGDPTLRARGDALWKAHRAQAPASLRARGAAGFSRKAEQLALSRARVLSDDDLQDLLRWSVATGRPLNLRGCNLGGANLRGAVLRGACLSFTDATGADTRGADLEGASLDESQGWRRS
jgi:uncharacterized protein YjbI with pentapeptide repeats